jgi:hypothetical protein
MIDRFARPPMVGQRSGDASLSPRDLLLRFVEALARHQARKDHEAEIEGHGKTYDAAARCDELPNRCQVKALAPSSLSDLTSPFE